ncbi:Circadian clock protein kinase KaiC [Thalassoglobus neptunius]|uniref:non-specific serine/threonine protein kinase n=2 Tax=Thalassoglobus neptunius TaxID=1938619 RepID=A0A5C5VAR4_9PLAN|nr:Circadian clock protein kinase KaiC [Thalassoglobus neptunius]
MRVSTGIESLDAILHGGLSAERTYPVEGEPGTGKTTLGLQFLFAGRDRGEKGVYVTLAETTDELKEIATSHGWSLEGIHVHELLDPLDDIGRAQYTMFEPSEVEFGSTISGVQKLVDSYKPERVVFDSLSEMRLLSQGALRYRRQILALKRFFVGRGCTTLLLDDRASGSDDQQLQSLAHGVIRLEQRLTDYGNERRYLRIIKHRGSDFIGGAHDISLGRGGIEVFPRATADTEVESSEGQLLGSGLESLDNLLGGGVLRGSSTLLIGPAGVGKSSMGIQFAVEAASRGERAVLFEFEESEKVLLRRSEGLGFPFRDYMKQGLISVCHLQAGEITPNEFALKVRNAIKVDREGRSASVVLIDSLNGYVSSMPHERYLTVQLHDILMYLGNRGVTTFLVVAQHGMLGNSMGTPVDTSYLADAVILFRYFEAGGKIRRALSVVKNRTENHERSIREYDLTSGGLLIGEPLVNFRGVLAGTPEFVGNNEALLSRNESKTE